MHAASGELVKGESVGLPSRPIAHNQVLIRTPELHGYMRSSITLRTARW
jgi:hypothetical protein